MKRMKLPNLEINSYPDFQAGQNYLNYHKQSFYRFKIKGKMLYGDVTKVKSTLRIL